MVGEAKRAVEQPRGGHVADVRVVAERELVAAVARAARADASARVRLGQRLAAPCRGDELDRVDDLHVPRAAAEVAEQRVRDLVAGRVGVLLEQRLRLQHDAGRAVAALRRAGGDEAVGPHAPLLVRQPLLRHDVLSLDARRLLRAGDDRLPVDDHRAGAARALGRAAVLDRAEPELLAQHLEQALAFPRIRGHALAVEGELHLAYSIAPSTSDRSAIRSTTPLKASTQ